jgi:YHS domain-containing protein
MNMTSQLSLRSTLGAGLMAACLALAGCSAMVAQNPSSALKPVNAVPDPAQSRLMLKGADVTAYFTQGRYEQGSPEFTSRYEGVDFRFASAQSKQLFDKSPQTYLPQYGGYCANGIMFGIPWGGDADTWRIVNGKLYIYGGQSSQEAFELSLDANIAMADRYWEQEVKGSNSFVQRLKRLTFKVPHYQTSEQQAQAVAQAKARAKP